MNDEATTFLDALFPALEPGERAIFCGFPGDPATVGPGAWRPFDWKPGDLLPISPERTNGYITQATFRRAPDGTWRRRADLFSRGFALMIDDIGTKVPESVLQSLEPSAMVETSPGNFQAWYFLAAPEPSRAKFDAVIKAFINQKLLGNDPGMNGVNRVGRIPGFLNGKAAYGYWRVKLQSLDAERRYTLDEIRAAFNLTLHMRRPKRARVPADAESRIEMYRVFREWMDMHGMLKRDKANIGGWTEITCPWIDQHTNRADTGAAISEPNPENEWFGGFQCHHGHCINRDWSDLTQYISDESASFLEHINDEATKK